MKKLGKKESLIINKLDKLKLRGKILDYKPNIEILKNRWVWHFSVTLINGTVIFLEIDDIDTRNIVTEKLKFYRSLKIPYCKIESYKDIEYVINNYIKWYSIPLKNTLITSHKIPDGDSLSSAVAIYNFLNSRNKKVALRFNGDISKNLSWIIEEKDILKKIPDWVENIIVLDCAPTFDRIGWELPNSIPIYNIDHHINRILENDPENNIHVINSCSTAAILFNYFGIHDDILSVGIYTDTFFTKNMTEAFNILLHFDEEKVHNYISKINMPGKKLLKLINESEIHRCRNGFIIVETEEDSPDIIESFMQVLLKIGESVCLLYGNNGDVKLRTCNEALDLSQIARQYSGGGHKFAAMCNVKNKILDFKSKIIALEIPKV